MFRIAPSILSANFARLGEELGAVDAEGADYIHMDVMDNHFVPNLTMGPAVIKALRPHSPKPFDVHLMIEPKKGMAQAYEIIYTLDKLNQNRLKPTSIKPLRLR